MARRDDPGPSRAVLALDGRTSVLSATDVGRFLRRERMRRGLSLKDVSIRAGIPEQHLRAAETGVVGPESGLMTLRTVRRYARFLGLPGDAYALAILDQSPPAARVLRSSGAVAFSARRSQRPWGTEPTAVVPSGALGRTDPRSTVGTAPWDETGVLGDDHPTWTFPVDASWSPGQSDTQIPPSFHDGFSDTGVNSALCPVSGGHPRGAPVAVRTLIVVVLVAVLAGVTLLTLNRLRPAWLRDLGLLKRTSESQPAATSRSPLGYARTVRRGVHTISSDEALVYVGHGLYTVVISAIGGPCWVDVTTAASSTSTYEGIVRPGTVESFASRRNTVILLGSSAGRFSVTSKATSVTDYRPRVAPMKFLVSVSS